MERDKALDITKGIGILLVIIGHFPNLPHWAWQFIFSFHMPLFFIVSGYLYKPKRLKESLVIDLKRLMIPYFITCVVILLFYLLYWIRSGDSSKLHYYLIASLVGNGSKNHECVFWGNLPSIGAIWFLPALLVCKNVYNVLCPKNRLLYSAVIFLVATVLGRYVLYIPFSVFSGLSAIIYFAIGDKLKGVKRLNPPLWGIGGICWAISIGFSTLSIARPRLDLYYVDVIGATFATVVVYLLSSFLQGKSLLSKPLAWIGQNSLIVLCIHLIDLDCGLTGYLNVLNVQWLSIVLKLLLPIAGAFLINYLIFHNKKQAVSVL